LTILLDVPVGTSLRRGRGEKRKKDRLEKETFQFHQKIREGFLIMARQNRKRITVVDGTEDVGKTWQKVKKVADSFLSSRSQSAAKAR
jgi:dTMP kinase